MTFKGDVAVYKVLRIESTKFDIMSYDRNGRSIFLVEYTLQLASYVGQLKDFERD